MSGDIRSGWRISPEIKAQVLDWDRRRKEILPIKTVSARLGISNSSFRNIIERERLKAQRAR